MTKDEALTQLREVHAIQGRDGCWDIDDYMLGLYNGLELALSIVENRECRYKQRPKSQPEQEFVAWEQFYPDIGKPQLTYPPQGIYYTPPQRKPQYDKTKMNCFVQDLYDKKMLEGKHGHYETMFHVVHQAIKIKDSGLVRCTHPVKDLEDIDINITWNENSMRDFGKDELNFARAILRKAQEK